MQIYNVPFNFKHEEKVFGGYLSIRQAIYLLLAICSVSILFIPILDLVIKLLIFTIILVMFILFAFLKIDETNTDRYFVYILKFVFRKKKYVLEKGKGQW